MFRASAQTPGGSLKSLCCVCAAELGQAPGTEGDPGNQEKLQKDISLDEQIFSQPRPSPGHREAAAGRDSSRQQSPGQAVGESATNSSISHFLLLALADTRQLQLLHFCLFLGISLAALLGNGLIISAVACGHHLHTPMFFFLLNLALTDLGCICTTVPKAMHNSLWDTRNISYTGCAAQVFLFVFFISAEYFPPDHHVLRPLPCPGPCAEPSYPPADPHSHPAWCHLHIG
uniref:G-protein coupled receptors family 1 profile domain-containing protein n=1 Tax=Catharus ustulatus TaxID=91951 RepID=A0A8C3UCH5_CATUS